MICKIKNRFYQLPISTKLTISFLIIVTLFAIIGSYIGALLTSKNINSDHDRFIEITIKNSEVFIARNILEDNKWNIYKFIKSISKNEFIIESVVYDTNFQTIAHSSPLDHPIKSFLNSDYLEKAITFDISMGDKKLAYISVFKNQEIVDKRIYENIKTILFLFVFVALGSWLFAIFISKRVLERLNIATKNARYIADGKWDSVFFKDFQERDEISLLLDSMSSMSYSIKEKIEEIDRLKSFYHHILSSIDLLILIVDSKLIIRYNNGHSLFKKFDIDFLSDIIKRANDRNSEGSMIIELKYNKNYYLITSTPLENTILVAISDISNLKELERRYSTTKSLALLGEMSAFLSHELKNLLAPLKLLLHAKTIDSRDIEVMKSSVQNMDSFIVNFLNFAKPIEYDDNFVSLKELCEEVIFMIAPKFKKFDILLYKDLDDIELNIHPKAFEIIVLNLLLNSIDACKREGCIWISLFCDEECVYLDIKDNGEGIDEEILENIFNPFFTTKSSGNGLGLALVYRIVNDLDGEISVESQPKNTRFTITFQKRVKSENCSS